MKGRIVEYCFFCICTLLMLSCSPNASYKVKSFFFDGVPNPGYYQMNTGLDYSSDSINFIQNQKKVELIHPPFKEKLCGECHDKGKMATKKLPFPDLCYQCHQNFEETNQYMHGPANNDCTQCHEPHKAWNENLLIKTGEDLCLNCHNKNKILENSIHAQIDQNKCMDCHNPHGGNNKFFLNQGSCFECHTDFNKSNEYVHGPVATGDCSICHVSHELKTEKLLKYGKEEMCLSCHSFKDIKETSSHLNTIESCVSCHNPHAGNKKYMLQE